MALTANSYTFLVTPVPPPSEVPLCEEVSELLSACERPDLQQTLLLPEDVALRHLPALRAAHKRLDMERESPTLSTLQEVTLLLTGYVLDR